MVILAFPSTVAARHPSSYRDEEFGPCGSELSVPSEAGPSLRILRASDELAASIERVQTVEAPYRRHLAARASGHAAALAGSKHPRNVR